MKKIPKIFRKPISEKDWNKKILGKIYLPEDREFLESLKESEGRMIRLNLERLDKKQQKRIKSLSKVIGANRKGISFGLLLCFTVLIGGALLWQFILKTPVLTKAAENQLEKVFLAQVEIRGLEVSLVQGRVALKNLIIADRNQPMQNLVELSDMQAELDTYQLSLGKVHITELGFKGLQRGTPRSSSGLLEGASKDGESSAGGESDRDSSPLDKISASLGKVDPQEILDQEMENLTSPGKIEEAKNRVEELRKDWETRAGQWEEKQENWRASSRTVQSIDADSFRSLDEARSTLETLNRIAGEAREDSENLTEDYQDALEQQQEITDLYQEIQSSINEDYRYLENFITLPGDQKLQWASEILQDQMGAPVTRYLGYYQKGREWYERFQDSASGQETSEEEQRRTGRRLPLGPQEPPRFVLYHGYASGSEDGLDYDAELFDLSSNPGRWEEPPQIDLNWDSPETGKASAVLSTESGELEFKSLRFDLGNQLEGLGLDSLSGDFSLQSDLKFQEESLEGTLSILIPQFEVSSSNEDPLSRAVQNTLRSTENLQIDGIVKYGPDGMDLSFSSELDRLLSDAMGSLLQETATESLTQLKERFGDRLEGPLKDLQDEMGGFSAEIDSLEDLENQAQALGNAANKKKEEIEESVRKKAEAEAAKAVDALGGLADSLF